MPTLRLRINRPLLAGWSEAGTRPQRRIAGFQQMSGGGLNANYPLWPEPGITPDTSEPMRARLQAHFDAKGLRAVPEPRGAASELSREHLSMLMRTCVACGARFSSDLSLKRLLDRKLERECKQKLGL